MSDALYRYYDSELHFVRELAREFKKRYPATASRLLLEDDISPDPHVERLIEAFALIAGRIQHKLDDEYPELTDSLFSVLYPHYLAPVPSMAIVQFNLDLGKGELPNGFLIERHSKMRTRPVPYDHGKELPCEFRTGYPVTLWPITLTAAKLIPPPFPSGLRPPEGKRVAAVLRLQLECFNEGGFAALSLDRLRFYLHGEKQLIAALYELLFNHVVQVAYRPGERDARQPQFTLGPAESLAQVGFERDEDLLPYPSQSFVGYRLLTEFFSFPSKFLFVDLCGLQRLCRAGYRKKVEVVLYLDRTDPQLEQTVNAENFRLGCAPIVNLFEQTTEPIALTHVRHEYLVTPDVAHPLGMEVYAVNAVKHIEPGREVIYHPFYSFRHGSARDLKKAFWYTSRRAALVEGDRGTDVHLVLVDLTFEPRLPAEPAVVVWTLCTNRDLPNRLQHAGEDLYLELEAAAPLAGIQCLRMPTAPLRPHLRRRGQWRLVSHLSLNHLSLAAEEEGVEALREILQLYDFSDPEAGPQLAAVTQHLIEGITSVRSRPAVGRLKGAAASGFARGTEVAIEFDEQKYIGTGVLLFACVLERFLGLYTSLNSFTQMVGSTKQGSEPFKRWAPRAGEHQLL